MRYIEKRWLPPDSFSRDYPEPPYDLREANQRRLPHARFLRTAAVFGRLYGLLHRAPPVAVTAWGFADY